MTNESVKFKYNVINHALKKHSANAMLFLSTSNRFWITGIMASQAYVVYTSKKQYLLIDSRYFEYAKKTVKHMNVILYKDFSDVIKLTNRLKITKLLIEKEYVNLADYELLKQLKLELIAINSMQLRAQKTAEEIIKLRKSSDLAVKTIDYIKHHIQYGMTELDVKKMVFNYAINNGADALSFDPIVAFGKNSAIPHHQPDFTKLTKGLNVKLDLGCVVEGYCSDITRTFWLDDDVDQKIREIYKVVLEANQAGIKAAKIGITGKQLDKVCRDVIEKSGYGQYFTHGTGHGIGIEIHEMPSVKSISDLPIYENSAITIEPGIYIPGVGGVRIEDLVIVSKTGPKVLTLKAKK